MARLYRLRVQSPLFGQNMIFTCSFISTSDLPVNEGCGALANALGYSDTLGDILDPPTVGSFAEALKTLHTTSVIYSNLEIIAPYDLNGLYDVPFPTGYTGSSASVTVAPQTACALRFRTGVRNVKSSSKRPGGFALADYSGGGAVTGPTLTQLTIMSSILNNPMTGTFGSSTTTYSAAIETSPRDPVTGKKTGGLFTNEADAIDAAAESPTFSAFGITTTQNTRKRGSGT